MELSVIPSMSARSGLKILIGCLLLSSLAWTPAGAQAISLTPFVAPLNDFAELGFIIPSDVAVEAESLNDKNYTEGRYLVASLLLNESRVFLYLLYPCQPPEAQLDAEGLKDLIEVFDPTLNETIYSPAPLNITDRPAIWGQIGNYVLVAHQPSNQTVSIAFIDENVTETVVEYLLGSLEITVNENVTLLSPGYCEAALGAGSAVPEAAAETPAPEVATNETAAPSETAATTEPEVAPSEAVGATAPVEPVQNATGTSVEKTQAELAAIKDQFQQKFGLKV